MADNEKPAGYDELLRVLANLPLLVVEKRRRLGLSQRAAAAQTGQSFSTICRAEQGYDMRLSTAMALVEWIGAPDPAPPSPSPERNTQ
jgi:transcriptional regulator with XRE-family HTH domain